jgi:hypothetical protein
VRSADEPLGKEPDVKSQVAAFQVVGFFFGRQQIEKQGAQAGLPE